MATTTVVPAGGVEIGDATTVSVLHGGGQVDADIVIEWDFDGDGDFSEAVEDVTNLLLGAETRTGRDWSSNLTGRVQPGELRATFDNTDNRFSHFNAASPLTTPPNTLQTGRRLRVRSSSSTPDDPALIARDRFNRTDSASLANAETGQAWADRLNSGFDVKGSRAVAAAGAASANTVSTLDVGQTDHYVQATLPGFPAADHSVGVVARFEDTNNYLRAYRTGITTITLAKTEGGTATPIDTFDLAPWPGMTIGLGVVGSAVTVYVGGVPVIEATTTLLDGTEAGIYAFKNSTTQTPPAVDDVHVWDHVGGEVAGVIWSGTLTSVEPSVELGPIKIASVVAHGVLAAAAGLDVQSPRVPRAGNPTGLMVGDLMARAGLCHPPAPDGLDLGDRVTGPVGLDDGNALALGRIAEEVETGFLHETNEGHVAFQSAGARSLATPQAWFTDDTTGQFRYASIKPLDHHREIFNRVTAGVAASEPGPVTFSNDFADVSIGGTNHCDVTMPTVAKGDLVAVIVRRANQASGVNWLNPIWWINHRIDSLDAIRTRVYTHHCDGTESGTNVRFYTDSGSSGGAWVAHIYRIPSWYGATQGIKLADFVEGRDPPPFDHGFGRVSTLYIAICSGTTGGGAGSVVGTTYPDGYGTGQTTVFTTNGDVFLSTAHKIDCPDAENPTAFAGDTGFALVESSVLAIRGYNGEHDVLPTIKNPSQFGPSPGRFVTVNDVASQDAHNGAVRTPPFAPNLFATEADAETYGESVIAAYADDRPIVTITWPATISAAYRAEAIARRVGHKVWLRSNAVTGLGIDAPFFVEAIGHRWSAAGKQWHVTWELSPA